MLVLNILKSKEPNEVIYVETESKYRIIKLWRESMQYPETSLLLEVDDVRANKPDIPPGELTTLSEYLDSQKIRVDKTNFQRLAALVTSLYVKKFNAKPRKISRKNEAGDFQSKSYGYYDDDLPIIEEAFKKIHHTRG